MKRKGWCANKENEKKFFCVFKNEKMEREGKKAFNANIVFMTLNEITYAKEEARNCLSKFFSLFLKDA